MFTRGPVWTFTAVIHYTYMGAAIIALSIVLDQVLWEQPSAEQSLSQAPKCCLSSLQPIRLYGYRMVKAFTRS
jgi:hypothetical protein